MFGWKLIREAEYEALQKRSRAFLRAETIEFIFRNLDPDFQHLLDYIFHAGYPVARIETVRRKMLEKKLKGSDRDD